MAGTKKSTATLYTDRLATIYSNGANLINGADHAIFVDDLIASLVNKITDNTLLGLFSYDSTRTYIQSQGVIYDDGTGDALYVCTNATTTGVFNSSHWQKLTSSAYKEERTALENITTDPQVIAFSSAMPSTSYNIQVRVYDSSAGTVDPAPVITNKTVNGFTISTSITGANVYLEYTAAIR